MEIKFSYFGSTHNNDKTKYYPGNKYICDLTIDDLVVELNRIKHYDDKTELNAITPSLHNYKSRSETPTNDNYNGLIHLDFDKIDDPAALIYLFDRIIDDPYTLLCFVSPSGNGLKVFVQTDNKNIDDHLDVWKQVKDHYFNEYDIDADKACKDVKRLCFVPMDFNYYQAIEPQIFEHSNESDINVASNDDEILNYIVKKLNNQYKKNFTDGEKHDFSCHYAAEANRAGIRKEEAINYFFQKFNELSNDFDHHSDNITNYYDKYTEQHGTVKFGKIKKKIRVVTLDDKYLMLYDFIEFIKIGHTIDQFIFQVKKEFEEIKLTIHDDVIRQFFDDHTWLWNTAEMTDKGRLKDVVSSHVKIARLTRDNLRPRYDEIRQKHQIIEAGEYVDYSNKISNTITGRLEEFYNIRLGSLDKYIYNHDNTEDYNPILEYLHVCKQEKESQELFDIFCKYKRFHFENEEEKELFRYQVIRFCVFAVAQWKKMRVCDVSLVAVSATQGTGKTTFFEFLFKWFGDNKLRGQADYDITRIDVIRKWCGTANLHDDEIFYRNKRDNRLYKSVLSEQQFTFTEKYQTEMRTENKIAVLTQCTNDMSFLKEYSRRDYVLRFAENTNYDPKKMRDELDRPEVYNGWWAFILKELETNYNYYDQVPDKFKKLIEDKMVAHVEVTSEDEFVTNHFEPADPDANFEEIKKTIKLDLETYKQIKIDVNLIITSTELQNLFKDTSGHTTTKQRLKNSLEKNNFVYRTKRLVTGGTKGGWLMKKLNNKDVNETNIKEECPF